jgi:putative transposase
VKFIDAHKGRFGVAPICRVLSEHGCVIAPSTYYDTKSRPASKRSLRDKELKVEIARVHADNYGVYGPRNVWLQLNREGIEVARCTVEVDACP